VVTGLVTSVFVEMPGILLKVEGGGDEGYAEGGLHLNGMSLPDRVRNLVDRVR
jgi:hypothetical protein